MIDEYVKQQYGDTIDFERDFTDPESKDYDVILSGMRAANRVELLRPVDDESGLKKRIEACA